MQDGGVSDVSSWVCPVGWRGMAGYSGRGENMGRVRGKAKKHRAGASVRRAKGFAGVLY